MTEAAKTMETAIRSMRLDVLKSVRKLGLIAIAINLTLFYYDMAGMAVGIVTAYEALLMYWTHMRILELEREEITEDERTPL